MRFAVPIQIIKIVFPNPLTFSHTLVYAVVAINQFANWSFGAENNNIISHGLLSVNNAIIILSNPHSLIVYFQYPFFLISTDGSKHISIWHVVDIIYYRHPHACYELLIIRVFVERAKIITLFNMDQLVFVVSFWKVYCFEFLSGNLFVFSTHSTSN